jgi:hypothetical protein
MLTTTAGRLVLNNALPEDMRNENSNLDKAGTQKLMQELADKHPDKYRDVAHQLIQIGAHTAYLTGGHSFGLKHMHISNAGQAAQHEIDQKVEAIYGNPQLSQSQKEKAVVEYLLPLGKDIEDNIYKESVAEGNPLAMQVMSGARGSKTNLKSLRGPDLVYLDHKDRPIPVAVTRSYSQGLSPVQYYAGTFGTRKSLINTKFTASENTEVLCHDYSVKKLKDIKVGDMVMGASKDGALSPVRVTGKFDHGIQSCNKYIFEKGITKQLIDVVATGEHKILMRTTNYLFPPEVLALNKMEINSVEGYKGLMAFAVDIEQYQQRSWHLLGGHLCQLVAIESVGYVQTYDLEVSNKDHLYVLANGIISHNSTQDAGFSCLVGDTLVSMADGSDKEIKDIKVGDMVMGCNINPHETPTKVPVKVTKVFSNGSKDCYQTEFKCESINSSHKSYLRSTLEHKLLTDSVDIDDYGVKLREVGCKHIDLLWAVAFIKTIDGEESSDFLWLVDQEYIGVYDTYDIEVDHPDHVFVLSNGLIVSNSKQFNQAVHRLVVNGKDAEDPNTLSNRGLPVDASDPDNEGALLAFPIAGYKRDTVLTPKILSDINAQGHKKIVVRSPIVGGPPEGGVYGNDVGMREKGRIAPQFDNVGMAASQSLSEPLSQAQLSSKHTGGIAKGESAGISGFKLVNQLTQVPHTFKGGAAHSQVDGRVQSIQPAPQGGSYITINNEKHYVARDFEPTVKPGQEVEAGDVLSEGIPNPAEIVKHKGIGEGRRYFMHTFKKAYTDSGMPAHRRNVELMARGLIDHVRMTDELGDHNPGDVTSYSRLEHHWKPREGSDILEPKRAAGMYLEKPVLHYSIGTKIRPSVVNELNQFGVNHIMAHPKPPPFEPEMIRGLENLTHDPDWMTRFLGSYLQKNLLKGVHRGDVSDEKGTSYVPSLARSVDFGRKGLVQGYKPSTPSEPKPTSLLE